MIEPPDPLAGRDPHPREQIDTWPLHDARQELLEEIVSQPGAGNPTPSARRFMLPVGIAAALALVAGGAWAVVGGDDGGGEDDPVVAASSDAPSASDPNDPSDLTPSADATTDPSAPPKPRKTRKWQDVDLDPATVENADDLEECLELVGRLGDTMGSGDLRIRDFKRLKRGAYRVVVRKQGNAYVIIGEDCGTLRIRRQD